MPRSPVAHPGDANVKVFGCRPHDDAATRSGGRRPKTSKGGNRAVGTYAGAALSTCGDRLAVRNLGARHCGGLR